MRLFAQFVRICLILVAGAALGQDFGPANGLSGMPYKLVVDGMPILLSGYGQFRYTDESGVNTRFQLKRLRFAANARITEHASAVVQFEAAPSSPGILLDGYLQYKPSHGAGFRAGQFKIPFSGENLAPDERTIPIERSIVVNSFAPGRDNGQQGRDRGGEFVGRVGAEGGAGVEYQVAVVDGNGIFKSAPRGAQAVAMRIIVHPIPGISAGGDFYRGSQARSAASILVVKQRQEIEAGYTKGKLITWGEYLWGRDGAIHRDGGYGLVAYRWGRRFETFVRPQIYRANDATAHSVTREVDTGADYYLHALVRMQANYGLEKPSANGAVKPVWIAQLQAEF